MSTIDLRDTFHTLQLAKTSQKYCGITSYYGSPTYHYLCIGMSMSMSPQIWQQFVDLVFQDDIIKRKQNFDMIIDDTFIHCTKEEHMDDLMDLFKVLRKYGLKISSHKCQFFKKKIVYMGLEFQVKDSKVCYTTLKDKCEAFRNLESPKTLKQTRAICGMVNFLSTFLPNLRHLLIPIYDLQKKSKTIGPLFIDTALDKMHYRLKDATGLLLDGTYHVNHIRKGSAHTPQGLVKTFDDYEKALKNTLLNKSAIESPDNKFVDVTLKDGSKGLTYSPCTLMDYASIYGKA